MAEITLEEFEADARAFLEANAARKDSEKKFVWGEGADKVAVFEEKDREQELACTTRVVSRAGIPPAIAGSVTGCPSLKPRQDPGSSSGRSQQA